MESKYIEAAKHYYEELEGISKLTPIEEATRDLLLSISEEVQDVVSIEQCDSEKYDRLYTLLLSLFDVDLRALVNEIPVSLFGKTPFFAQPALLNDFPDQHYRNVLKRHASIRFNTPNARKELIVDSVRTLSELSQLDTHELFELLSQISFLLAVLLGCLTIYSRTWKFIAGEREKLKNEEEYYAIMFSNEPDYIKETSSQKWVADNYGHDEDVINTFTSIFEDMRPLLNRLNDSLESFHHVAEGTEPLRDCVSKFHEFMSWLTRECLSNHDTSSKNWTQKEIQTLDSIIYQPFMKDFIDSLNNNENKVRDEVKEIPSSDKKKKTKDKLESLLRPLTPIPWQQASEVFDKAIEEEYITWDGFSDHLTWTKEGIGFEYMCGILFCGDYREKANNTNTWATENLRKFPREQLTSTIQLCEEKKKKTSTTTEWGRKRKKKLNETAAVPESYAAIESLFPPKWQEKYGHKILRYSAR